MPVIQIHLLSGRSDEKKRKLVAKVTEAVCASLEVEAKDVCIILSEMNHNNYSIAGQLIQDKPKV